MGGQQGGKHGCPKKLHHGLGLPQGLECRQAGK